MAISRDEVLGSRFAVLAASAADVKSTGCVFIVVSVSGWIYGGLSARLADHPAAADHDDADSARIAAMGAELLLAAHDKRSLRRLALLGFLLAAMSPGSFAPIIVVQLIAAFFRATLLRAESPLEPPSAILAY